MARKKKDVDNDSGKSNRKVTYEEVKPSKGIGVSRENYMRLLDITHAIRPELDRPVQITKEELLKKFPDRKKMIEDVWYCVNELKLKYPMEMIGRVFDV